MAGILGGRLNGAKAVIRRSIYPRQLPVQVREMSFMKMSIAVCVCVCVVDS